MATPFARSMRSLEADGSRGILLTLLIAAVLLGLWAAWFIAGRVALYEVTTQARLEVDRAVHPVDARVEGRVVAAHLDLGRIVTAGEVLVELDADEQRSRLDEEQARVDALAPQVAAIGAELVAEEHALDAARRAAASAIDEARSQLTEAEPSAGLAEEEASRLARLRANGLVTEVEELRARAEAQRRRATVDSLRLGIQRLDRSHQTEAQDRRVRAERLRSDLTRLRGQIAASSGTIRRLTNDIERRRIRAPLAGRLGEVADLRVGAFVAEGQKLGAIIPTGQLKIVAEFPPSAALGRIRAGQPARLRLAGFPWTEYGSVPAIVDTVASEVRSGTVRVELVPRPDAASAVPFQHGLPGSVEVEVERISPAALVLRAGGRLMTRPLARSASR